MRLSIKTKGFNDIVNITKQVNQFIKTQNQEDGVVNVFVVGSTAAVTTIEFETGVIEDIKEALEKLIPFDKDYEHHYKQGDDNGAAHLRAALVGPSISIPFENQEMILGTWQQLVLVDFDTMEREREIVVKIA